MAGRKPKNAHMTQAEIIEMGKHKRSTRIYKEQSDEVKNESISKAVQHALVGLKQAENRPRIDMNDIVAVRGIVEMYLETCMINSYNLTMADIAMILGYTRMGLYNYMAKQDTETAKFLHQVHDKLADILAENALKNNVNNITAIFLLKALYGYRDTTSLELLPNSPNREMSLDEIAMRAGLLSDKDHSENDQSYKDKYRAMIGE